MLSAVVRAAKLARPCAMASAQTSNLLQLSAAATTTVVPSRTLMRDFRKSFKILRDRPVGPYKMLAPGVKDEGRVGPRADYKRIIHYPEDGK